MYFPFINIDCSYAILSIQDSKKIQFLQSYLIFTKQKNKLLEMSAQNDDSINLQVNQQQNNQASSQIKEVENGIINQGFAQENQVFEQVQIPSNARLQKLKKEINWPHSYSNQILKIDLKKKLMVMQSKVSANLSMYEQYKNGQIQSNLYGNIGLTASLWKFEADITNFTKNCLRAKYTQKDIVSSQYFKIKKFSFNFQLKNLNEIKMKPSIEFSQNNIDFRLEGTIQQKDSKQKTALHEFSADITHVINPFDQLYFETVFGKRNNKNVDLQFNTYYLKNSHILNSRQSFVLQEKSIKFKELSFKYQNEDVFELCSGYNHLENTIWYSSIQRFKNYDIGLNIQKQNRQCKAKKESSANEDDYSFYQTNGTSINFMCKFKKLQFAPNLTAQFHLENFNYFSLQCKYKLSNKNMLETVFKLPLLSEGNHSKFNGDNNSRMLPFFLTLKLSE
ncbi:hypothetical protein TTHERM_001001498 (macronuclear) [Tetrahymena thermophila SB210]|uniref:Uncharacterized protein n=1 Tax=Tetrahymena thermophila (strain SB210) TaxID=312017 RepID=W7XDY7_TETTS|nr:hypothetical protein TTHERM_001001498 [Tetrahymena thermophila SB210]EWS71064.1 hypothetical protein TTHERM_001001498 [Tetrahymena thermophila SB210]|eukprot:XP_012656405.1 hypothetical protein TTHERM_001001498 [Tetrahymena thermophila SB210]